MRILVGLLAVSLLYAAAGCKSGSSKAPKTFCDTTCFKDTLKFSGEGNFSPYVYLTAANCRPDKIIRSFKGMGANLTIDFGFDKVNVNKDFIRCVMKDTSSAYLLFNDCMTGRGYQIKLPFNKTGNMSRRASGINSIDPKFSVAPDMIAYTDRGNIYVEQVGSGKKQMMTFGKMLDIDYDAIHEYIDTVNVTSERIWVKVKVDNKWKEIEKKITLE